MIRRPPRSTLFPTRRSSDLAIKEAEEALRQSKERFRTLTDAVPQIIWANDEKGKANLFKDRKSTRLNSSHANISYAVFCLKKTINHPRPQLTTIIRNKLIPR